MPSAQNADGIFFSAVFNRSHGRKSVFADVSVGASSCAHYDPRVKLLCPAKINLHLRVAKPGADGFHPLLSWFCTTSLYDILHLEPTTAFAFTLKCSDPKLPTDDGNLVTRAARRIGLAAEAYLEKHVPLGTGLGGGSSDAGRLLLASRSALDSGLAEKIAADLGSDVPFFLQGPSAICTGRGEIVTPIAPPLPRYALLILPDLTISTPAVYRKFDELNLGGDLSPQDWPAWAKLSAAALLPRLINDLEPAAFAIEPSLAALRSDIEQRLSRPMRMSGSGSSLFSLFDSEAEARDVAMLISERTAVVRLAPEIKDDISSSGARA
jgi:4-diphosphocytidyl-2-C-methyl-D-erythritol kinase